MNAARVVTWVPLAAIAAIMFTTRHQPWDVMRWAGFVLALAGFILLTVARINLGDSFSVTPEARQLVTRGVYSRLRHPVYIFGFLGIAGLILYLHLPIFLIVLLPLGVMQVFRARAEERVLRQAFGPVYEEYRHKTWF